MFLIDPLTRPSTYWMEFWIDMTRWLKSKSPTGAFDFFTYSELIWWFTFVSFCLIVLWRYLVADSCIQCVVINPFRWKWALFVFLGVGINFPQYVVEKEDLLRNGLDMPATEKTHTY